MHLCILRICMQKTDQDINLNPQSIIIFPTCIPLSEIIEDGTSKINNSPSMSMMNIYTQFVQIGRSLYVKYIQEMTEFEINIQYSLRKNFDCIFHHSIADNYTMVVNDRTLIILILKLFIDAHSEMYHMINYSFSRLKATKDYQRMIQTLKNY